jgi:hypothetical protein
VICRTRRGAIGKKADSKVIELRADRGSTSYGVLSNKHLEANAFTPSYTCTLTIGDGEWSYDETTTYEVKAKSLTIVHRDRNTLKKVG